ESLKQTFAQLPENASPSRSLRGMPARRSQADVPAKSVRRRPPTLDELPTVSLSEEAAELDPSADLTVERLLGEGGMGQVLLANQRSRRRPVAVKTSQRSEASRPALVREAVITGMLEHPNIPPVHGLSRDARGRAVMVMKHIEGVT